MKSQKRYWVSTLMSMAMTGLYATWLIVHWGWLVGSAVGAAILLISIPLHWVTRRQAIANLTQRIGFTSLGYEPMDYRRDTQLIQVWGPFIPARYEVWLWPAGTSRVAIDEAMEPLPLGSPEAYHRMGFLAEKVHVGRNLRVARAKMSESAFYRCLVAMPRSIHELPYP